LHFSMNLRFGTLWGEICAESLRGFNPHLCINNNNNNPLQSCVGNPCPYQATPTPRPTTFMLRTWVDSFQDPMRIGTPSDLQTGN
jgi:hypothetical protein